MTTVDPEAPAYTLRDLAADAAALVGAPGGGPAHLAGLAQLLVLEDAATAIPDAAAGAVAAAMLALRTR
jgi:hypothetical protein